MFTHHVLYPLSYRQEIFKEYFVARLCGSGAHTPQMTMSIIFSKAGHDWAFGTTNTSAGSSLILSALPYQI